MCTVTYIKTPDAVYITSNRDEHIHRAAALPPVVATIRSKKILFPKDPVGAGSWIALDENGKTAVLLNGAEKKHEPVYPYRKSRGLILLELISTDNSSNFFEGADLDRIEPFTIILFEKGILYQLRWNGMKKQVLLPDVHSAHIWSSVTLYTDEVIAQRKKMFQQFIRHNPEPGSEAILQFHQPDNADKENGFTIKRKSGMQTQSVTQVNIKASHCFMNYHDLIYPNKSITDISIKNNSIEQV
jgi:hypothetical protein